MNSDERTNDAPSNHVPSPEPGSGSDSAGDTGAATAGPPSYDARLEEAGPTTTGERPTSDDGERTARPALTPFLLILVAFLLVDALFRLGRTGLGYLNDPNWALGRREFWDLLLGTFYLLLVPQILLRSLAARVSLTLVFSVQIAMHLMRLAYEQPSLWAQAQPIERVQVLVQVMFFAVAIVILNQPATRRVLRY